MGFQILDSVLSILVFEGIEINARISLVQLYDFAIMFFEISQVFFDCLILLLNNLLKALEAVGCFDFGLVTLLNDVLQASNLAVLLTEFLLQLLVVFSLRTRDELGFLPRCNQVLHLVFCGIRIQRQLLDLCLELCILHEGLLLITSQADDFLCQCDDLFGLLLHEQVFFIQLYFEAS